MMQDKLLSNKLSEEVFDYLKYRSLPRQIFKFIEDEVPSNQTSLEFNKIILIEDLKKDFESTLHKLCVEMKFFEDNAFISELDAACKEQNDPNIVEENLKRAIVEAKVQIDRWDFVTTSFFVNQELFDNAKKIFENVIETDRNNKSMLYGANIFFDVNIPKHYIYALCDDSSWQAGNKKFNCGNVIIENFGFELSDDEKYIEVFSRFSIKIDRPQQVSRVSLRQIYNQ